MPTILGIIILIFSAILHEVSHGLAARALGDKTAEYAGRLSLNPLVHLDWYGSLLLPLLLWLGSGGSFFFAYAKPVPFNPYNLRDQKWGPALVGLAGPATNIILATLVAIGYRLFSLSPSSAAGQLIITVVIINVSLTVFNLLPLPPLDGSRLLYALLPSRYDYWKYQLEKYGLLLVLLLVFVFGQLLTPVIVNLAALLLGL